MIKIITDAALVTDVELKFGASGKAYAQFRAVSKERKRDAGGNWVDGEETFFSVVCFGKPAEMLAESDPAKGTRLIIEGKAKIDKWVSKQDGQERQSLSVVADHIGLELLGRRPGLVSALMIVGTPPIPLDLSAMGAAFKPSPVMGLTGKEDFSDEEVLLYAQHTSAVNGSVDPHLVDLGRPVGLHLRAEAANVQRRHAAAHRLQRSRRAGR